MTPIPSTFQPPDTADPRTRVQLLTGEDVTSRRRVLHSLAKHDGTVVLSTDPVTWQQLTCDAQTIPADVALIQVAGGGLCADASADPTHAIYQLHLRRLGLLTPRLNYSQVVIEIGARVDTGAIAAIFAKDMRLDGAYRISGVVHVVSDEADLSGGDPVETYRIATADAVVINETMDLMAQQVAEAAISAINPLASVTTGVAGSWHVPVGSFDAATARRVCVARGLVTVATVAGTAVAGNPGNHRHSNSATGPVARSLRMTLPGKVDLIRFMELIRRIEDTDGRNLLRLAAVLNVPHVDHPIAVDVVDGVFLNPAFSDAECANRSDICVTGLDLDVAGIAARFAACRRDASLTDEEMRMAV